MGDVRRPWKSTSMTVNPYSKKMWFTKQPIKNGGWTSRAVITVIWCEVFFFNIPLPCAGALLVGMCSLPTEDCGMFLVGWVEGVEKAIQKLKGWIHWQARQAFVSMLPGIRTYGIPIDQHINQITKQRNAQDYIGRSEALSVGRIWVGKLNERHVTWNLLLRWLGEFDLKLPSSQYASTTFHKGWNHSLHGLGAVFFWGGICLKNHGLSPNVNFICRYIEF